MTGLFMGKKRFLCKNLFRHLSYPQVQKCLPSNLPHAQMTFFRVVSECLYLKSYSSYLISSYMISSVTQLILVYKNSLRQL